MRPGAPEDAGTALREGAAIIERCQGCPPEEAKRLLRQALLGVVRLRNACIGSPAARIGELTVDDAARLRQRLNALLSLMASVEFPLSAFNRDRMACAAREIRAIEEDIGAPRRSGA
ncbi:hypothetical protein WG922_01080 [Ramlibacter sp. AN1015]|uniref:hypothetical protein n=1 Tax=Ramlibacter sp. AN1015 TaxID=3133428 RepID=UPI0030BE97B8